MINILVLIAETYIKFQYINNNFFKNTINEFIAMKINPLI